MTINLLKKQLMGYNTDGMKIHLVLADGNEVKILEAKNWYMIGNDLYLTNENFYDMCKRVDGE